MLVTAVEEGAQALLNLDDELISKLRDLAAVTILRQVDQHVAAWRLGIIGDAHVVGACLVTMDADRVNSGFSKMAQCRASEKSGGARYDDAHGSWAGRICQSIKLI